MDFKGKVKWDVWKKCEGMLKEDVMTAYVALVVELKLKYGKWVCVVWIVVIVCLCCEWMMFIVVLLMGVVLRFEFDVDVDDAIRFDVDDAIWCWWCDLMLYCVLWCDELVCECMWRDVYEWYCVCVLMMIVWVWCVWWLCVCVDLYLMWWCVWLCVCVWCVFLCLMCVWKMWEMLCCLCVRRVVKRCVVGCWCGWSWI